MASDDPKIKRVDFSPKDDCEPDEGVIEAMKDVLGMAKEGELQSVALAGLTDDGSVLTVYCDNVGDTYAMIGAIDCLKDTYKAGIDG